MGVSPAGGGDRVGWFTGGGYLYHSPPDHNHAVHCDHTHYGPVSGGGEAPGVTYIQAVVGSVRPGIGVDADGVMRGGTGGVGG